MMSPFACALLIPFGVSHFEQTMATCPSAAATLGLFLRARNLSITITAFDCADRSNRLSRKRLAFMETPASLLERLKQPAPQDAWDRFVRIYTPFIYDWARQAGLQTADAADLVQEVLTSLIQKLPQFTTTTGAFGLGCGPSPSTNGGTSAAAARFIRPKVFWATTSLKWPTPIPMLASPRPNTGSSWWRGRSS